MSDPYSDIPELADLDIGGALIRVPMEINVPFTRRVRALVDTVEFQRLGQISQLGLVSRVYPGARHTRFEHALGVYHNALCYLHQLRKDRRFCAIVDSRSAELLLAAALLHDLGHWPFCHPIEDLELLGISRHERHAARFLGPDSELPQVLRDEWGIDSAELLDVLSPRTDTPRLRLLRSILSGPIDIDKMDYLDRDSLHCGVPYGRHFDRHRLIQSLLLNASGDGLAISYKGKTAAELMVFARYVMFSEVYWHHAVRSATSMFARGFYELSERLHLDRLFAQTESELISELRQMARGTSSAGLIEGVFGPRRALYKRVAEYGYDREPQIYEQISGRPYMDLVCWSASLATLVGQRLGCTLAPTSLLIDAPPPHREVEFEIDVYYPQRDEYRRLQEVSPVVDALARTQFDDYAKRVRVYGDPAIAQSVKKIADFDRLLLEAVSSAPE
ncbi:MAG: HD domain-containing protein [Planctomycetaceae bacterium]|nr:HD domain-containing protein [Planctomycetaceae bacterium]